jgi:hypothetical protein
MNEAVQLVAYINGSRPAEEFYKEFQEDIQQDLT